MPFPHEHAARQNSPTGYKTFRRKNGKGGPGIDFIFGITADGKAELQSVRFDSERFTAKQARAWLEAHDMKTGVEAAKTMVENRGGGSLEHILINATGCQTRYEELEGRRYLVVPMVMLTEGVHQGSKGPLYYPPEELAKTPAVWNTKPIVVYHPKINGQGVSACTPEILSSSRVGMVMGTRYEDGKLKAEAWLDDEKMDRVDPRIRQFIANKQVMEISTGLFTDNAPESGDWRGEPYTHVARNYRPDHLALLPDETGACSAKDGAGLLRNQSEATPMPIERIYPVENGFVSGAQRRWYFANWAGTKEIKSPRGSWTKKIDTSGAILNAAQKSHNQLRAELQSALQERFGDSAHVEDVYPKFIIYCRHTPMAASMPMSDGPMPSSTPEYYKLGYGTVDGKIQLDNDSPTEVRRVMEYQTVDGDYVANLLTESAEAASHAISFLGESSMPNADKQAIVSALIANESTHWDEDDREFLMELDDAQIDKIAANAMPAMDPDAEMEDEEMPMKKKKGKKNDAAAPAMNAEEYIAAAPPEIREMLRSGLEAHAKQKTELVEAITANEANQFERAYLEGLDLPVLQGIAALARKPAAAPVQNTRPAILMQGAAAPAPALTQNAVSKDSKPLLPPKLEFDSAN